MKQRKNHDIVMVFDLDGHLHDSEAMFYQVFKGLIPLSRSDDKAFKADFLKKFTLNNYVTKLMGKPLAVQADGQSERARAYNELFKAGKPFTAQEVNAIDRVSNAIAAGFHGREMFAFIKNDEVLTNPKLEGFFQQPQILQEIDALAQNIQSSFSDKILFDNIADMVKTYNDLGAKLYVLSSGQGFRIHKNLKHYGLDGYFKVICNGEGSLFPLTNKPEALEKIAALHNVDTVFFSGDGDKGVADATNARGNVKVNFIQSVYAANMLFAKANVIDEAQRQNKMNQVAVTPSDLFRKTSMQVVTDACTKAVRLQNILAGKEK